MHLIYHFLLLLLLTFSVLVSQGAELIEKTAFTYEDKNKTSWQIEIDEEQNSPLNDYLHTKMDPLFFNFKETQLLKVTAPSGFKFWNQSNSSFGLSFQSAILNAVGNELGCTQWIKNDNYVLKFLDRNPRKIQEAVDTLYGFIDLYAEKNSSVRPGEIEVYRCEIQDIDSHGNEYSFVYDLIWLDPNPKSEPDTSLKLILVEENLEE